MPDDAVEILLRKYGGAKAEADPVDSLVQRYSKLAAGVSSDSQPADEATVNALLDTQGHGQRVEADIAKWRKELDRQRYRNFMPVEPPSEQALAFEKMGEEGYRKAERDLALKRMGGVPTMGRAKAEIEAARAREQLTADESALRRDEAPWLLRHGARLAVGALEQAEKAGEYVREKIVRPFYPESAQAMDRSAEQYGMSDEGKAIIRKDTPGLVGDLAEMLGATAAFVNQVALGGIPAAAGVSTLAAKGDPMAGVETVAFLKGAGALTKWFGGASESLVRSVLAESGAMTAAGVATRLGFHGDPGTLHQAGVDMLSGLAFGVTGRHAKAQEAVARFRASLEMGKSLDAAAADAGIPASRLKVPVIENPIPGLPKAEPVPEAAPKAPEIAPQSGVSIKPTPEPVAAEKPVSEAPVAPVEAVRAEPATAPVEAPKAPVTAPEATRLTDLTPPEAKTSNPVVEPPGEAPREYSIRNKAVEADRAARGLEPIPPTPAQTQEGWMAEARKIVAADPEAPLRLTADLHRTGRAHTPTEVAVLTIHRAKLSERVIALDKEAVAAMERGDAEAAASATAEATRLRDQDMHVSEVVDRSAGAEAARALGARAMAVDAQYELIPMETRRRVLNDGAPLTEKQRTETREIQGKLDAALKAREAYEKGKALKPGKAAPVVTPEYGKRNTFITIDAYKELRKSVQEKLNRMSANPMLDPSLLVDLAKMGAFHVEAGARSFASWSRAMLNDMGEKVGPHLKDIWRATQSQLGEPLIKAKESVKASIDAGAGALGNRAAVQKLAEHFVRTGVTDRGDLVAKVHEALMEFDPSITFRKTMDAISGYGVFKALDKDPAKIRLREIKAELQQVAKLEDMAKGQAPLKTGIERQAPTPEMRELTRRVNEEKKRGGYDVTDPEAQLRTALESTKTRLKNQIDDLAKQIETRTKNVRDPAKLVLDEEATALKQRRDELRAQFYDVFGKPGLTEAQRVEAAIKATEKSIAEYERKIATGDVATKKVVPVGQGDPRLDALRARRDALSDQVQEMRDALKPKVSPEERALRSIKTRLSNQLADLTERIATRDFTKKPPNAQTPRDAEAIRLEAAVDQAKSEWHAALMRDVWAKKSAAQKTLAVSIAAARNVSRAIMTSMDLSAFAMQGGLLNASNITRGIKNFGPMLGAFRSKDYQARSEAEIRMSPEYHNAKLAGLFLSDQHDARLTKSEETMLTAGVNEFIEKVPVLGPLIAGSQRAYTTFLNRMRFDAFKDGMKAIAADGVGSAAQRAQWAKYINVATGRGGPPDSKLLNGVTDILFAPRLMVSRFQWLLGEPLIHSEGVARKLIAKEYARSLAGLGIFYGLASLMGGKVEKDGKIAFGNTRVDPTAGLAGTFALLMDTLPTMGKALVGKDLEKPRYGETTALGKTGKFLRNKLAPLPGVLASVLARETPSGEKVTLRNQAESLYTPMVFNDIKQAMVEQGVPKGTIFALLSILGVRVSTYRKGRR